MMLNRSIPLLVLLAAPLLAQAESQPAKKAARAPIYDEKADARVLLDAAKARAARDNKRVLVVYGGNWCPWCHKLHDLFKKNAEIARTMLYDYEVVMVDIGHGDKHQDLVKDLGPKIDGYPYLTVLAADGKVLTHHDTGSLEEGDHHDPAKVKAFLTEWVAAPLDAEKVVADGIAKAKAQQKMVFLHFGAPWCGWCHRLEDWLARPEIAAILAKDFVDVKVDEDRMTGGKAVEAKFRGESARGGIPWFVFLDAEGKALVTSDGPKGNTGFPAEPHEVDHFMKMLEQTAKNMTAEDRAAIEKSLRVAKAAGGH